MQPGGGAAAGGLLSKKKWHYPHDAGRISFMFAAFPPFLEDPDQLRTRLAEMAAVVERQNSALASLVLERDGFAAERDHFKVAYEEAEAERRRLDEVIQQLRRA